MEELNLFLEDGVLLKAFQLDEENWIGDFVKVVELLSLTSPNFAAKLAIIGDLGILNLK